MLGGVHLTEQGCRAKAARPAGPGCGDGDLAGVLPARGRPPHPAGLVGRYGWSPLSGGSLRRRPRGIAARSAGLFGVFMSINPIFAALSGTVVLSRVLELLDEGCHMEARKCGRAAPAGLGRGDQKMAKR